MKIVGVFALKLQFAAAIATLTTLEPRAQNWAGLEIAWINSGAQNWARTGARLLNPHGLKIGHVEYKLLFKWVDNVGVELEGGISESALERIKVKYDRTKRLSIATDSTVYVEPETYIRDWIYNVEIRYWSPNMYDLLEFVKTCFRLGFKQNSSCGNHHHFKFNEHDLTVKKIRRKELYELFKQEYVEFARKNDYYKYIGRLNNHFCEHPRDEYDIEIALRGLRRYYTINFRALEVHGTLEFRVLPYAKDFNEFKVMHIWLCSTVNKLVDLLVRD